MSHGSDSSKKHQCRLTQKCIILLPRGDLERARRFGENSVSSKYVLIENIQCLCIIGNIRADTCPSVGMKCSSPPAEGQLKRRSRPSVLMFQKIWANSQKEPWSPSLCCGHVKSSQKFSTEQEQLFLMCLVFWMRKPIQESRLVQTNHAILRHPLPSSVQPFEVI